MKEGSRLRETNGSYIALDLSISVCEDSILGLESRFALSLELVSLDLLPEKVISMDSCSLGNIEYTPLLLLYETLCMQKVFNCLFNVHRNIQG